MRTLREAQKIVEVVDAGLVRGLGEPIPGQMCVEAAICYALGLPHGDDPRCVNAVVRVFKIALNDALWSSPAARAQGLRALSIAQLDSLAIDGVAFATRLVELTVRVIVPMALRATGNIKLEPWAVRCEQEGKLAAAPAAHAARAAGVAEWVVAAAAARAARAAEAERAAMQAAGAAWAVGAEAAWAVGAQAEADDLPLIRSAELALQVLREMGAPGVALWDELVAAEVI